MVVEKRTKLEKTIRRRSLRSETTRLTKRPLCQRTSLKSKLALRQNNRRLTSQPTPSWRSGYCGPANKGDAILLVVVDPPPLSCGLLRGVFLPPVADSLRIDVAPRSCLFRLSSVRLHGAVVLPYDTLRIVGAPAPVSFLLFFFCSSSVVLHAPFVRIEAKLVIPPSLFLITTLVESFAGLSVR
jgi:hypothetical protein